MQQQIFSFVAGAHFLNAGAACAAAFAAAAAA
jgi:hypothetical protein